MAARPPQPDSSEPDAVEFGIAALDGHLDDAAVEYPVTGDELVEALGDPAIPYDAAGNAVRLSEALTAVPTREFESRSELLELLHPVFEDHRVSASGGLLARLRTLLPF